MISPELLERLVALNVSIEIGPSDAYNSFSVVLKKKLRSQEPATPEETVEFEQVSPFDAIQDVERNNRLVEFMLDELKEKEKLKRKVTGQ